MASCVNLMRVAGGDLAKRLRQRKAIGRRPIP